MGNLIPAMAITSSDIVRWIQALQRVYSEQKQYLTDLDAAIGDADHGINMDRGFTAALKEIGSSENADIGIILKSIASALIRTVGGVSGPLYGTFFLRAADTCTARLKLESADVVELFDAGVRGIIRRGGAQLLDKTMIDTLWPAVDAMKVTLQNGGSLQQILNDGARAGECGMKQTVPLLAKKGRASYLGERSIGHQDPGATSSFYMLQAAARLWE